MIKKTLHFIKYNNAMVLILAFVFVFGAGVFAQSEPGQAFIGAKETATTGVDNTLLLEADLDRIDMDFKIEKILEDEHYYYATYTYLDLVLHDNAWQYQLQERVRKITKNIKKDLGLFLAEELGEQYEARVKDLKLAQAAARESGASTRTEVVAYNGLIGQTLELTGKLFTNYQPVQVRELPAPTIPPSVLLAQNDIDLGTTVSAPDSYVDIYEEYVRLNDPDGDGVFGAIDNCPNHYNPDQADQNGDGQGDACSNDEEATTPAPDSAATGTAPAAEPATTTAPPETPVETVPEESLPTEEISEGLVDEEPEPAPEPVDEEPEPAPEPDVEIIDLSAIE